MIDFNRRMYNPPEGFSDPARVEMRLSVVNNVLANFRRRCCVAAVTGEGAGDVEKREEPHVRRKGPAALGADAAAEPNRWGDRARHD